MYSVPPRREFWSLYASINTAKTVSVPTVFWLLPWGNAKCLHSCAFSQTHGDRLASRCPKGHLQRFRCHCGAYTGSWPWGQQCGWDEGPRGEQNHKHGVCNGLGSLVGSPHGQWDHAPWRILALEAVLLVSPHPPAMKVTPVSWIRGERSVLEDEDATLAHTLLFSPQVKSCAEGSVLALSRATSGAKWGYSSNPQWCIQSWIFVL